ncbi:hypothetical protein AtDm6_0158 [Acetobacter tropicalis]|uniref:Uncharacterized protein n=1 Tax=Acetobacter tropicalis TaxID=104102 RepID=A0A094YWT9_9PROT|nr:hypothetical protein AtDm6_0158 [Acetobacter tropicalis]
MTKGPTYMQANRTYVAVRAVMNGCRKVSGLDRCLAGPRFLTRY